MRGAVAAVTATALALFLPVTAAIADGTEGLGAPAGVTLAAGTGVVTAGVGLRDTQPASFTVDVPGTAKQVLLYWTGHYTLPGGQADNAITINGHDVTGTLIGGPTHFFTVGPNEYWFATYRADITGLGLVGKGANTLTVGGMQFLSVDEEGNDGAGVTVIYDDGSKPATIDLRDGLDLAFLQFASPLDTTVPQTFTFPASPITRTANLATIASSIFDGPPAPNRPNTLHLTFDVGAPIDLVNPWQSLSGFELDAVNIPVQIPAQATKMTVQALSAGNTPPGNLPASLAWSAAALAVPPPPDVTLAVEKLNDANGDGTFTKSEIAPAAGADVPFRVSVTNTSTAPVTITDFTDEWPGTVPFTPQGTCAALVGTTLGPGAAATCTFTVTDYSPPAGDSLVDTVTVGGVLPGIPSSHKTVKSTSTVGTKAAPPQPAISLTVDKTNDANGDGTFTKNESAAAAGAAVPFRVVITNPSTVALSLTALTDQWPGTAPFTPGGTCGALIGTTLAPGASAICTFTQTGYAPPAKQSLVDTITVTGAQVGNRDRTVSATSDSTVSTVEVLAQTVEKAPPAAAATATPAASLPATGSDAGRLVLVGLALLLVGGNAIAVAAFRRRNEPTA